METTTWKVRGFYSHKRFTSPNEAFERTVEATSGAAAGRKVSAAIHAEVPTCHKVFVLGYERAA